MALTLDAAKSTVIDAVFKEYRQTIDYWPGQVMLDYSLMLHQAWRPLLPMLPIGAGIRMLDVGTGYGLLAAELAANIPISINGVDIDPHYVAGAREICASLSHQGVFVPGSGLSFEVGDISALAFGDAEFELTMVREVYQFIADPEQATRELLRVTKPTGFVCVSDNDDGFYLAYPEPSEAFRRLHRAVDAEQSAYGDRHVGRKLSTYLSQAGFDILAVTVMPEARHWTVTPDDPERRFLIEQVREAKDRLVKAGVIEAGEFDRLVAELESEPVGDQFRFNARVVVVGRKPAG